jgi:HrpA-like RNA helicase
MFVNEIIIINIKNVINEVFSSLIPSHANILEIYLIRLINIISLIFNFDLTNCDNYEHQLLQNNFQDIKWLLCHLLPFINENSNTKNIKNLNDIFESTKKNVDINLDSPQYTYSNLQYNRCIRDKNNYQPRTFNVEYLDHNFYLLVDSLKTMSNKLMVNWMDIIPFTIDDFKEKKLYIDTKTIFYAKKIQDWDAYNDVLFIKDEKDVYDNLKTKINGLNIEDIYNTISNDLFQGIVNIKWLIYDIPFFNMNNRYANSSEDSDELPLIIFLYGFFENIPFFKKDGANWIDLSDETRYNVETEWKNLINLGNNNMDKMFVLYKNGPLLNVPNSSIKIILLYLAINFDKEYKNNSKLFDVDDEYIEIEKSKSYIDDDDEDIKFAGFKIDSIIKNIKSINSQQIFIFIQMHMQIFRNTWYGYKLLNETKNNFVNFEKYSEFGGIFVYYNFKNINDDGLFLSYKNIYNFSKSFTHFEDAKSKQKYKKYPDFWKSLDDNSKLEILKRTNDEYNDEKKWFNIKGNIKRIKLGEKLIESDKNIINKKIYQVIRKYLIDIVFEVLITKGVLTYFEPDRKISDKNYISRDFINKITKNKFFKQNDNNLIWTSAFNFYTGIPYKFMEKFDIGNGLESTFDYNSRDAWYKAYSLDWIAQIGFCHHFINNRITFITGGTGVGKSTFIPNLYAYYLKAIDFNNNGKIACSEPRISPTDKNAKYVATLFGVPISDRNNMLVKKNYNIQIKHSASSNVANIQGLVLKYITDGTLVTEINNPIMTNKKTNKQTKEITGYGMFNIYDIIMIDEAHEHGENLDIILTLIKTSLNYNNNIRLVIISATMDDDDPIYRRYYRNINDNRKYPLNNLLQKYNLDRINIDRRYHISPPGTTTRFEIKEFYRPCSSNDSDDYNNCIIDIIKEINSIDTTGDVLIFQPGVNEITKLIKIINDSKITPSNMIALPLHAKVSSNINNFLTNLNDENRSDLKISKDYDIETLDDINTGKNSYSRIFIVATNIAEASITFKSLKYVIETGTQKINEYDYVNKTNSLNKKPISESSRLQRKGRVGRTQPGTVYYVYNKGDMETNRIIYSIAITDLSLQMYNILDDNMSNDNKNLFLDDKLDPNNPKNLNIELEKYPKKIKNIFEKLYFINDKYFNYFGNNKHYDYDNYEPINTFYNTGYSIDNIIDKNGKFYLIHPDELQLVRNINGDITNNLEETRKSLNLIEIINYKYKKEIESFKVQSFIELLQNYNYLNDINKKTDFGKNMIDFCNIVTKNDVKKIFSSHNLLRTFFYSLTLNKNTDIIYLITLYKLIDFDIKNLVKTKINIMEKHNKSDNLFFLTIIHNLFYFLKHTNIDIQILTQNNIQNTINDLNENMDMSKQKLYGIDDYIFTFNSSNNLLDPNKKYKKILSTEINTNFEQILIKQQYNMIHKNKEKIRKWCDSQNLKYDIIIRLLTECSITELKFFQNYTEKTKLFIESNVTKISQLINKNKMIDYIDICFLLGFPFNVCKKMINTKYYISLSTISYANIFKINVISEKNNILSTYVDNMFLEDYILYLHLNNTDDTIKILSYVNLDTLILLKNIYNINKINKQIKNLDQIKIFINEKYAKNNISNDMYLTYINIIRYFDLTISNIKLNFNKQI